MKLHEATRAGVKYWRAGQRLGRPLQVGFAVNNTCNTFCQMCNIWRMKPKSQLSLDEMTQVFSNALFDECVTVSLTGGEPTMRKDFGEIPVVLSDAMPRLRRIAVTTNGYATERILESFEHFLPQLADRGVAFSANVSIDGVGDVHNAIRNNKRAWGHLERTIDGLVEMRARHDFNLVLACTLSKDNIADARNVLEYAEERGLYIIFRNAFTISRIDNLASFDTFAPTRDQLVELGAFYRHLLEDYDRSHARQAYYSMLLPMLAGAERSTPCLYRKAGLFIDHVADMYVCTVFSDKIGNALSDDPAEAYAASTAHREELAAGPCRGCSHDVSLYLPARSQGWDRLKSAVTKVAR